MVFYLRLTLILLLLIPSHSFAEDIGGESLRLTLSQAVTLALDNNSDLALSRNRVQSAKVSIETANGRFLPSLQGSISSNQNFRQQNSPGEDNSYRNANLQLATSINLFNGFSDQATLDASRQQHQEANANLRRQQQFAVFTVASDYTDILINKELVQVALQNLKSQQDLEQQIEAFYSAGNRSITDYYQQRAATAQAEFSLADAERNLQVSKLRILQMLGHTQPVSIEVLPIDSSGLDITPEDLNPNLAIEQALITRPDLIALQRQIEAAQLQTKAARAGYFPSLDLQATTGSNYNSASSGNFSGQFDDNRAATIGLTLTVPIFDRYQTRTNVAQAKIAEADATTTKTKLQQQIGLEVGQAIADYQRAKLQLTSTIRQLDYARQALESSEARYQVGAANWVELSTARANFIQAQGNEVYARYGVLLQGLNIGYVRGDIEILIHTLNTQESSS
ncbi:MAG: TolC family protein [Desulfuromusa sp.]|jgi:outer membrane protein|nr:TolC family protein [Desulfuromusa sp.]